MPEIRYYTVTETREVKVTANSAIDAARIAEVAFTKGQSSDGHVRASDYPPGMEGVWGNTTTRIKQTTINVEERR